MTGADGSYRLNLLPGAYDVTATAFAHASRTAWNVQAISDTVRPLDLTIDLLPLGTLAGEIRVGPAGEVPTRTLIVHPHGTPITTAVDLDGHYALKLPEDEYEIEIRGLGYRIVTTTARITAEVMTQRDFELTPAPTLLLVDEGGWYYGSEIAYWRESLDKLQYAYDEVLITQPWSPTGLPLAQYDLTLWSSPEGSPGLVGAGTIISETLGAGGRLLLSGQNVAYWDSGQSLYYPSQHYLREQLSVRHLGELISPSKVHGAGPFAGLSASITGEGGANNQRAPDLVEVGDRDIAELLWQYEGGGGAGVAAHVCTPYRALFFAFGYEAISDAGMRREVLGRSIEWLTSSPPTTGLTLSVPPTSGIAPAGSVAEHPLRLRHVGVAGSPVTVTAEVLGAVWPTTVTPTQVTLSPCESQFFTVTAHLPSDAGMNAADEVTFVVTPSDGQAPLTTTLRSKTPAPVLLVDDDRWYQMGERYATALRAAGVHYDVWDTQHYLGGLPNATSVSTSTLAHYPTVLWFTGYDWYAPVTPVEEERLLWYLDQGGRLLLSSQDFLYYGEDVRPLARRMGVLSWAAEITPTVAQGVVEHPAGGIWGPVELDYPYLNWSDGVEPAPGASVVARADEGRPVAVGRVLTNSARTLFYGLPLETLPPRERAQALSNGVGWLSSLGRSRWSLTPGTAQPGEVITAEVTLRNDGGSRLNATFHHPLPDALEVVAASLPPEVTYASGSNEVRWKGTLEPDEPLTLRWRARVAALASPQTTTPTLYLGLPAWDLTFSRVEELRVARGHLELQGWATNAPPRSGLPFTLTLALHNPTSVPAEGNEVRFWLAPGLAPVTASRPTTGTALEGWAGDVGAGGSLALPLTLHPWSPGPLRVDLLLDDAEGLRRERSLWLEIEPHRFYLPVVVRDPH
jgi:hypothetical protein